MTDAGAPSSAIEGLFLYFCTKWTDGAMVAFPLDDAEDDEQRPTVSGSVSRSSLWSSQRNRAALTYAVDRYLDSIGFDETKRARLQKAISC